MVKTMKKSLAVVLALAVYLSLFCVPASAVGSTIANNFPYMLCNYENDFVNISGGTIVEGGMGGSGHALQITTTNDSLLKNKWGSNFGATIPEGSTLRVSFYVKLSEAVSSATFSVISYQFKDCGYTASGTLSAPSSTDWQKVTINYIAPSETVMQAAYLRPGVSQTFLIDDFEAVIVSAEKSDQIVNMDEYYAGYEGTVAPFAIYDSGYRNATTTQRTVGGKTIQVVANPAGSGQVVKYTADTTVAPASTDLLISNSISTGQYDGGKAPAGTVANGETATLRFKYYLENAISTANSPGMSVATKDSNSTERYFTGTDFGTTAGVWHTAVLTYTNDTGADVVFGGKTMWLRLCKNYIAQSGTMKAEVIESGSYGDRVIYFDDMEMYITAEDESLPVLAAPAASSNLVVTGNATAGNVVSFSHTFTPATSSAQGVTDASVVRIVNYTASGEKAVIDYCGIGENFIFPATPANSARMMIEVVPVGSDGTVGDVVTYAVPSAPAIVGITLTQELGSVTVSTDTALTAAKLIFVTYDANNKLVDWESIDVTLSAQAAESFSPVDLTAGNYTKAMLWVNMTDCTPLADMIQY